MITINFGVITHSFVDFIFGVSLFFNAAAFIPQAVRVLRNKSSGDLSLITFIGFNVMQIFTAWHGYLVRDYVLMSGFLLSLVTCGIVTVLIVFYREDAHDTG